MTDSAQEAAVDAVADILRRFPGFRGDSATVARKRVAGDILDALLSPTNKPCADPQCIGGWNARDRCPDCVDGFVSSPAPIEGLGWVKVSELEPITVSNDDGAGDIWADLLGRQQSRFKPETHRVIGWRLPSKVREG